MVAVRPMIILPVITLGTVPVIVQQPESESQEGSPLVDSTGAGIPAISTLYTKPIPVIAVLGGVLVIWGAFGLPAEVGAVPTGVGACVVACTVMAYVWTASGAKPLLARTETL